MILEPLTKRHKKNDSLHGQLTSNNAPSQQDPREEIGSGLQMQNMDPANAPNSSQKSHRMRQTDYSRGFMSNLDMD